MSWHNKYIPIQFEERGRTTDGADCWGLCVIIYHEELGIELPSLLYYNNTKEKQVLPKIIHEEAARNWIFIPLGEEQPYDIAVFKTCGVSMHVGVVTRPGMMVHCQKGNGTHLSDYINEREWNNRLEGFYRYAASTNCASAVPPAP